jgi:crotonobetainyl-CoA:carnitine CoA-transferase CaiB-like acyl-CoA transferase
MAGGKHDLVLHEFGSLQGVRMVSAGTFRALDERVTIAVLREQYGRLCKLLGLDPKQEKWQHAVWHVNSPEGLEFDAIFRASDADRCAEEVLREPGEIGVPCAPIISSAECAANPHFQAREMHIEWEDGQAGRVKGIGMVPKLSATPGRVWRGAVGLGHDNRLIYSEVLGLDDGELKDLSRAGVI